MTGPADAYPAGETENGAAELPGEPGVEGSIVQLYELLNRISRTDYPDDLERSYDTLRVVIRFLDDVVLPGQGRLTRPLNQLLLALHDRLEGGSPVLLGPRGSGRGAPGNQSQRFTPGALAGLMDVLMQAGVPKLEASQIVRSAAFSAKLRDHKGEEITATQIASWRDRAETTLSPHAKAIYAKVQALPVSDRASAMAHMDNVIQALNEVGLGALKTLRAD